MSAPDHTAPLYFGVRGMAAALCMTEDEFRLAYRNGAVGAPDTVLDGAPRWFHLSLAAEVKARLPEGSGRDHALLGIKALIRAERAEGLHDGGTS